MKTLITRDELYEKLYAGLVNFMIGDALGAPIELLHYKLIDRVYGKYGIKGLVRPIPGHPAKKLKPWSVTDDTRGLILTINTILKYDRPSVNEYTSELIAWAKKERIFEVYYYGPSTKYAIKRLNEGASVEEAGAKGETCGGPIRSIPAGIFNPLKPKVAAEEAILYCKITHGTSVALSAAAAIASFVSLLYTNDIDLALKSAIEFAKWGFTKGKLTPAPSVSERIKLAVKIMKKTKDPYKGARRLHDIIGIGLHSSEAIPIALGIFCKIPDRPKETIFIALNMGGDTDSIAAIVGLLTGIYSGKVADKNYARQVLENNEIDLESIVNSMVKVISKRI